MASVVAVTASKEYREVSRLVKAYKANDKLIKELRKLQKDRTAPVLSTRSKINIRIIRDAILKDQFARSRLSGMKEELTGDVNRLDAMRIGLINRLTYNEFIKTPTSTKTDRRGYIETTVNDLFTELDKASSILEQVDIVLEDIDKTAWNLRLIVQTFELTTRPELNL